MNAYYTNTNSAKKYTSNSSEDIRRAYLADTRKAAALKFFASFMSGVDSVAIWNMIFALKVVGGIVCAIGFFTVLGLMDGGIISVFSGVICTLLIVALECLCFMPIGEKPKSKKRR